MRPRRTIYVGTEPPPATAIDWVLEPAARVALDDTVAVPDMQELKRLLEAAAPVLDDLCSEPTAAVLRDEFRQLMLSVARAEATVGQFDGSEECEVVHSPRLSRPSRPGRLAEGLATILDADLVRRGPPRPRRFPAGAVGRARALRWSRGRPDPNPRPIVLAVGGPSEKRALAPVLEHLDPGSAGMLDFGLDPDPELASFGSFLTARGALGGVGSRALLSRSAEIWGSHDWWGRRWLPWVRPSLTAMAHITLREAVLFREAARRGLGESRVLLTAKVRFARARAILTAAADLGIVTIGMQHGVYVAGLEWTDIRTDVFAVTGASFERILRHGGYRGDIRAAGAPFFSTPDRSWDCGIALQPPEGVVITSAADYARHAGVAHDTARKVLGESVTIGFRLHPREDPKALRRVVGAEPPVSRDPAQGAASWISIESSFVVEAALSGAQVALLNLNDHPWEYPFASMPGSRVATSERELGNLLESMSTDPTAPDVDAWRREFAVSTGDEAAAAIAGIIREVLD